MSESYLNQLESCQESLPGEKWLPVNVGCEEISQRYLVSSMGRVLSCSTQRRDLLGATGFGKHGYYLLKQQKDGYGYPAVVLYKAGVFCKSKKVHSLVMGAFVTRDVRATQINHIDGDKANNKLSNLEWSDAAHNTKHAYSLGLLHPHRRLIRGEGHIASKFTDMKVREIRALRKAGIMPTRLARAYGVTANSIHRIVSRRGWNHVA